MIAYAHFLYAHYVDQEASGSLAFHVRQSKSVTHIIIINYLMLADGCTGVWRLKVPYKMQKNAAAGKICYSSSHSINNYHLFVKPGKSRYLLLELSSLQSKPSALWIMKLKVRDKGFGSYYSGFIQVIFGFLPCILKTYVVKLLLCKIHSSWLWISCIVLTPIFYFNFSPLRAAVFGIFLILIWALYPAVLSNWTPNHLAELNFSSGEGCEVS